MKKPFILFILIGFSTFTYCQTQSINRFYYKHKNKEDVSNISLPGWIVKFGLSVSGQKKELGDLEKTLIKSVRKLRLLNAENSDVISDKEYNKLLTGVKKENFEELIVVREEDTHVAIFVRDKKDKIKNLLILVNDEEDFTMISLKTKLKMSKLKPLIQSKDWFDNVVQLGKGDQGGTVLYP